MVAKNSRLGLAHCEDACGLVKHLYFEDEIRREMMIRDFRANDVHTLPAEKAVRVQECAQH